MEVVDTQCHAVSLHEYSSKAENRELSQNKAKQGQKSNEEKHKDNIQYLSTPPISAGKSARSRSSLGHADILKGGFDSCQKQKQNRNDPGCKNAPGCRYSSMPTSRAKTCRYVFEHQGDVDQSAPRSTQSCDHLTLKLKKRPKISACAENHLSQETRKRKSAFEDLPWSRAPARSLSVLRHRALRETNPAFHAVVHAVLVHDLVCLFVLACLPHPERSAVAACGISAPTGA